MALAPSLIIHGFIKKSRGKYFFAKECRDTFDI
jgi:hypothetical protein